MELKVTSILLSSVFTYYDLLFVFVLVVRGLTLLLIFVFLTSLLYIFFFNLIFCTSSSSTHPLCRSPRLFPVSSLSVDESPYCSW